MIGRVIPHIGLGHIVLSLSVLLGACSISDQFAFAPQSSKAVLTADSDIQPVSIETEDGEQLVAWRVVANEHCPTVVGFHGNAQHLSGLEPRLQRLGAAGIGYLALAYRGYSGSTGKPTERGVRRDAKAAYQFLINDASAPEQIVIEGFSLGSSVAVGLAAEQEAGALVLLAPFESGKRMASDSIRFLPMGLLAGGAFRSDRLAGSVEEPVLIVHGSDDGVISPQHSEDLLTHFSNTEVKRLIFPGRRHNDLTQEGLDEDYIFPFLAPLFPGCEGISEAAK